MRFPRELAIGENTDFGEVFPVDARLFYTSEGIGKIALDGSEIALPKGSALLINAGISYRIIPTPATYLAVNFDWTQNFCTYKMPLPPLPLPYCSGKPLPLEKVRFEDCEKLYRYSRCENALFAENSLRDMIARYEKKTPYYQLTINAELVLLLTELVHRLALPPKSGSFHSAAVADYLQAHYQEDITNQRIAELFHFHPNYIGAEFRRVFGKPLHRYLLELRITKAIGLLETGQHSVEFVAREVGFKDVNYFIRYFKKITGKTPKNIFL